MIPVDEVEVRWLKDGTIVPVHFRFGEIAVRVVSVGRSWRDEHGFHVLCMSPADSVYELILAQDLAWYVRPPARRIPG